MKKSVIIAIIAVYLLSIVLVGVMGGKLKTYDEEIYVSKIICENAVELPEEDKEALFADVSIMKEMGNQEELVVEVVCKANPATATNKTIMFYFEEKPDLYKVEFDSVEGIATVTFYKKTTLILRACSVDNGKAELRIRIDVY
jgi:hypothetical protein